MDTRSVFLEKSSNSMFAQIVLLLFMWLFVYSRTALEVRNKFSKSNIKKKKRGILNRIFFYKFHKERSLGIWYNLNIVSPIIIIINIIFVSITYKIKHLNIMIFIIFTVSSLFAAVVSSIAEVKTTKDAFKTVHGTEKGAYYSIIIGSVIIIISSIVWVFYLYYIYAAKINLNG